MRREKFAITVHTAARCLLRIIFPPAIYRWVLIGFAFIGYITPHHLLLRQIRTGGWRNKASPSTVLKRPTRSFQPSCKAAFCIRIKEFNRGKDRVMRINRKE